MYPKEGVSLRLNFGDHGESKLNKNQTEMNRAVIKDKLGCGIVPCLNHGKCTLYPFGSLGFLCICPPGFYGDFCQHRAAEPITIISLIGIIAIPILILALCFAICCICNRERLHHQALKKNSEICLNPSPVTCAPKPPRTDRYQEEYERRDCICAVEPENLDNLLCGRRSDPCQYDPELIGTLSSVADCQQNNVAEVERCTGNYGPCPAMAAEDNGRKHSSHSMSQGPCPAVKQSSVKCQTDPETVDRETSSSHIRSESPCPAALVNNQQIKAAERERRKSSPQSQASCPVANQSSFTENEGTEDAKRRKKPSSTRSQSPCPAHARCSVVEDEPTEAAEGERKISTSSTISQDPCPVADSSTTVKNEQTKAAEGEKKSTSSARSRRSCPGTIVKNEPTKAAAENRKTSTRNRGPCPENLQTEQPVEGRRTSSSSMRCVPLPENQLIREAQKGRRKSSTIDSYLDPRSAYEFNCLKGSMPGAYEDSEHRTRTTESSDQMFVEKCDAECQFSYPASREPSEDCKNKNDPCLDEVEQASSNFQCKNQEIIPCNNLSDSTTSSQSSYQEYLSTLPTDISTPRSESSSQTSSSSEIADDFGNKSECSLNSSIPSEALLNLMQSYFANGDDVKSVKISILLDKSQSDDFSHSTNVKESTSRISDQMNSPSTSEGYSKMGLKNNCHFLDYKNTLQYVGSSLTSLEHPARNCTSLDSPEFGSLIPAKEVDSSDWYCADKEPCSKATTVRYMFTDSETDA